MCNLVVCSKHQSVYVLAKIFSYSCFASAMWCTTYDKSLNLAQIIKTTYCEHLWMVLTFFNSFQNSDPRESFVQTNSWLKKSAVTASDFYDRSRQLFLSPRWQHRRKSAPHLRRLSLSSSGGESPSASNPSSDNNSEHNSDFGGRGSFRNDVT